MLSEDSKREDHAERKMFQKPAQQVAYLPAVTAASYKQNASEVLDPNGEAEAEKLGQDI